MHSDAAHTTQIHNIFAASSEERVETGAKKLYGKVIKLALDASGPEGGHAEATLERWVEVAFIAVGGAVYVCRLELQSSHLVRVQVHGAEDGAYIRGRRCVRSIAY